MKGPDELNDTDNEEDTEVALVKSLQTVNNVTPHSITLLS